MRPLFLTTLLVAAPAMAHAHTGHWGTLAGHDHWIALSALGLAGLLAAAAIAKGRKRREEKAEEDAGEASGADA